MDKSLPEYTHADLGEGEAVTGIVDRLPLPGAANGNSLFLSTPAGRRALHATAKSGHTVLERLLQELRVCAGDSVTIRYLGKRSTADGEREYRCYEVEKR